MNVKEEKAALRLECARVRGAIAPSEKEARDEKICRHLGSLAVFRYARKVLLYYPIRSEVNILPLMQTALSMGKEVYFPLCHPTKEGVMTFHRVTDAEQLTKGSFSVPEPSAAAPLYEDDSSLTVCVIPALAYDREGFRLGYGKGYYDRFLSTYRCTKLGIVYSDFILSEVPRGRFDRRVDILVTERGIKFADKQGTK